MSAFRRCRKGRSAKESGGRPGVRAGTLLPGLTAYISDGTAQNELPAEDSGAAKRFFRKLPLFRSTRPGEILLSGDCVAMGLYNDPAGTRALFPGDRLLRTGEFGSLDGRGRLTVTRQTAEPALLQERQDRQPGGIGNSACRDPLHRGCGGLRRRAKRKPV